MNIFNKNKLSVIDNKIKTIPVRDLKDYLVKDFQQIQNNEIEKKQLKEKIEELEKIEIKYKAVLITLEEFDARIEREKANSTLLENKIENLKEEVKQLNEDKNNCIIRERQAIDKINNVKKAITDEFKINLCKKINNTKGTLSKKSICQIIEKVEI